MADDDGEGSAGKEEGTGDSVSAGANTFASPSAEGIGPDSDSDGFSLPLSMGGRSDDTGLG
jgi:hypothetical protein